MEIRIARIEENTKDIYRRLEKMEKIQEEIQKLTISVNDLAQSIRHICNDVTNNNKRLCDIEGKPSKRWDLIVNTLLGLAVGAIFGYILTTIFGG